MSKGTLLLADDSITIQKVVNLTFADEGIDVVAVGDGDTAAARLADVKPDIVLADVNMPGLTGYQICEMIRQNESTKDLPVVLLVGSFEPFDEAEAHRVGASSYMTKPFQSIRQLVSQVTDLMEGRGAEPEVVIPVAESEPAVETVESAPETTDIESLYQSSFEPANETAAEQEREPAREYVDAGMDDEMILTTYTDAAGEERSELLEERAPFVFDTSDAVPTGQQAEGEILEDTVPTVEGESTGEARFDQFSETQPIEVENTPSTTDSSVVEGQNAAVEAPNVFDVPDTGVGSAGTPAATASAAPSKASDGNDFDEVDLLEIPGIDSGKTLEFATEESAAASETPTQVVSLSPELMEMIVQKVVEKLSEKY